MSALSSRELVAEPLRTVARLQGESNARWWRRYVVVLALLDAVTMAIVAGIAQRVWFGEVDLLQGSTTRPSSLLVTALLIPGWVLTLGIAGAYHRRSIGWSDEYRRVFDAAVRFVVLVGAVAFLLRVDVARGFVLISIPLAAVASLVLRFLYRRSVHRQRRLGRFVRNVLVVGSESDSIELVRRMRGAPHAGLWPVAACTPSESGTIQVDDEEVPVLAGPDAVLEAVVISRANAVAVADPSTLSNGALRQLAWQLEGTGVDLMVTPAVTDLAGPRISIRPVPDLPLLHVEEPELNATRRLAKETFDRVLAATALLVLSPVMLVVALVIRLTSRGPVLFRQVRVGLAGRHFVLYKFRTMTRDAESRLADLAHLNEHDGVLFKMRSDPRVTPAGRVLRRWSVDELPQLWNVLRGEMSIVGPRPPLPSEVERYSHQVRRRLLVKPGLTGLWQVSGRAGLPWEEAVRLDLYYVENWSLSMDAMIIARSVAAVLRGHGAC